MKKSILICMLVSCVLLLSFPTISFATGEIAVDSFASLQTELQKAAVSGETADNPTVIMLTADITTTSAISVQGYKTLVSDGNHTITRGHTDNAMFVITGGSTVYSALNLGIANSYGTLTINGTPSAAIAYPIIYTNGAKASVTINTGTITGGAFTANAANVGGGAIRNAAGTVTINGGTITNCSVISSGSYANTGGGAIYSNLGSIVINGGTISNCSTVKGSGATVSPNGGAIYNTGSASLLTVNNAVITGCTSAGNAGAIYTAGNASSIFNFSASTISHCTALIGGGIQVAAGTANLTGGTITECSSTNTTTANNGGGGIFTNGGTTNIDGVTISNCTATLVGGGVSTLVGATIVNFKSGTIDNCTAPKGGGINHFQGTLTITGGTIQDCTATGTGGGGIANNATLTISAGLITGCDANVGTTGSVGGGGIYDSALGLSITGGTIQDCTSTRFGGGLYKTGNFVLTLAGGTIDHCTAASGGGIFYQTNTFTMSGNTISNCTATADGGGIGQDSGTAIISSGLITDCTAGTTGGGLSSSAIVTINDGTIQNCSAGTNGGGIYFAGSGTNSLTITGGTIQNCSAPSTADSQGLGGGICLKAGILNLNGGTISGCSANAAGPAVHEIAGTVNLNGGTITNCLGKTINVGGGAITFGASYVLPSPQRIALAGATASRLQINADITTPGRVAILEHPSISGESTICLQGANVANNYQHFAGYASDTGSLYGLNPTAYYIDTSLRAPLVDGEVEPSITEITGITGNVADGYTVNFTLATDVDPTACIIIALYDVSGNLVGVNSTLTTTDTTTDITATRTAVLAKLMVWDNLSDIKPLIDVVPFVI